VLIDQAVFLLEHRQSRQNALPTAGVGNHQDKQSLMQAVLLANGATD